MILIDLGNILTYADLLTHISGGYTLYSAIGLNIHWTFVHTESNIGLHEQLVILWILDDAPFFMLIAS